MKWTEVDHTTVLGKDMGLISLKWRIRYRYFEKPYGTGDGLRYMRKTRGWYKPFETINRTIRRLHRKYVVRKTPKTIDNS